MDPQSSEPVQADHPDLPNGSRHLIFGRRDISVITRPSVAASTPARSLQIQCYDLIQAVAPGRVILETAIRDLAENRDTNANDLPHVKQERSLKSARTLVDGRKSNLR